MTRKFTNLIFSIRPLILLLFLIGTVVMGYYLVQLRVDAGFKKQLPLDHEYMQTFIDYEREFGGANRIMVALMADDGEMFTPEFFNALEEMTDRVFYIPGVERASVQSIFTPNVRFVEIVEEGFAGGNVIPAEFAPTPEMFRTVRANIVKSGQLGRLVAEDYSGAMIQANLLEEDPSTGGTLDYQDVAAQLEAIRADFEGDGHTVRVIGFAKIVGDIADGARGVVVFFGVAFLITALLLLLYSRSMMLTALLLVCAVVAVIWQLGLLSLLGFGIDPMNILTPFLIFAIAVSHGVQMISCWSAEKFFGGHSPSGMHQSGHRLDDTPIRSSLEASQNTLARLLAPGAIALLSDTVGFLTIFLINIRIIQELAITASIGVAVIIFTNMLLLPIILSYARLRNEEKYRTRQYEHSLKSSVIWRVLACFSHRRVAPVAVLTGVLLFGLAWWKAQDMKIGDDQAGVPELRSDARYNQDAHQIAGHFSLGTDLITIIAETDPENLPEACTHWEVMDAIDRFAWKIRNVEGVQQVISLPMIIKIMNAGWNEGSLRWRTQPRDAGIMALNLQYIEASTGLFNHDCSAMPVIVFTEDHKAETIARVVERVKSLREEIVVAGNGVEFHGAGEVVEDLLEGTEEVTEEALKFRLAAGNVGVMAATNEDVSRAQLPILLYVYAAIIVLCLITFRSLLGTLCIVLPLALVSFLAYALMAFMGIGLKVNTLPVVALGVGIGVDYGIYIFSRLRTFLDEGLSLDDAYFRTLRLTGRAVLFTAITLAVGVGTWLFSELKFQADMGILLAFMFIFNMIGATVLLPALARILLRWREA